MDLIDRESLLKKCVHIDGLFTDVVFAWDIAYEPTVDAVPVVHGHWIILDECANEGVYCSVCHKKVYKVDYAWSNKPVKMKSNFCPKCGADMREVEHEAD